MGKILKFRLGFLFLGLMLLGFAECEIRHYDFVVKETNFTKLCVTQNVLTVNDSFPGPVLRVYKGDIVYVNVHNHGTYGISLHWHGVKQPRNPWSDGPEYITQCLVEPATNFTYEVHFSTEEGTLWWHAHSSWTRATVHGAIVILPAIGTTYPFPKPDQEHIIVVAEWYVGDLVEMLEEAFAVGGDTPLSNTYTINGEPGDLCPCSNETTYRWLVDSGKTYHLRIINAAVNGEIFFAISDHNLTLVGMDGAYLKPISTAYLTLSPGQTMDVLLAADQPPGHYYAAVREHSSEDIAVSQFDHSTATAVIQYSGNYTSPASPSFPATLPEYKDIVSGYEFIRRIRSLASEEHPVHVPEKISTRMFITVSMNTIICPNSSCSGLDGNRVGASFNNQSWVNPSMDVLQAYYRNISGFYDTDFPDQPPVYYNYTADDLIGDFGITNQVTKVKVLDFNETVEIVFQGTNMLDGSANHPMHLHGYSFYVVGIGLENFQYQTDPKSYNLVDPPEVNTFAIPKSGWITIRFTTNNPGVWFWHCHLDKHMSWGMDTVFIVKNGDTHETSIRPPPAYMPPCQVPRFLNPKNLVIIEEKQIQ